MPVSPSRALQQARDRGQKWLANETERMSDRFEKLRVYHGYNRIQPTLFAKGLTTMLTVDDDRAHFNHNFGRKSFSKRSRDNTPVRMSSLPKDPSDVEIAHQRLDNNSDSEEEFDSLYEPKSEERVRKDMFNNEIFEPQLSPPTTAKTTERSRNTSIYNHINNNHIHKTSNSNSKPMISNMFEYYNGNGLLNDTPNRSQMAATRF